MKRILLICLLATFMPYTAARSQDFSDSELSSELDQLENEIDQGEDFFNESADSGSAKDEFSEFEDDDFGDETTSESFDEEFGEDTAQEEVKPSEEPTDEFGEDEFGDEEVTETPKEEAVEKPEEAPQEQSFEEPEEQVVEPEPEEVDPGPTETIQEEVVHSEPLPMIDDPDLSYEAKLHSIYLNYHNEPTSDERWHEIVGNKASQTYVIQRGDTLWGISKILFGDGHFWPKVWSLNGAITNPHIIKEGNSIRFLMGDEGSEPAFTITEGNAEAMGAEDYDAGSLEEDVEIPPPGISSRQTIAHLPPSIEEFKIKKSDKTFDQLGFAGVKKVDRFLDKQTLLDYYVDEKEPKYIGLVKEVEGKEC
ncbi:MAG: LysM peptidoglycan-binding domain-containing protein, partial [Bdellovibrionales bacterium]|nr:LysM peptidoglycan-binding domain-containing protein [Bdellovibrionales bacterium]